MGFIYGFIIGGAVVGTLVYLYYSKIEAKYAEAKSKLASYEFTAKNIAKKL